MDVVLDDVVVTKSMQIFYILYCVIYQINKYILKRGSRMGKVSRHTTISSI